MELYKLVSWRTYIQILSYGAVSTCLIKFINSSLTSLSYGNVSTNLVTYIQNLSYGAVSTSLVAFIDHLLTSLSNVVVSTTLVTYIQNLSYGSISTSLVSFINSSLTSLSYGAVSTSLVTYIHTKFIIHAVLSSFVTFINKFINKFKLQSKTYKYCNMYTKFILQCSIN